MNNSWLRTNRTPPPNKYWDGCTCFFDKFGNRSHVDLCHKHDRDWWECRTLAEKIGADWDFCHDLVARHLTNGLWWMVALPAAIGAFVLFNTIGLFLWAMK